MPCWPLCCEREPILFKKFRPGHQAGVFIWETFIPVTEISVTEPTRPLIRTHRHFYNEKSGAARSRERSQPGWLTNFFVLYVRRLMLLLSRLTHYAAIKDNKNVKIRATSVKTIYTAVKTSPSNILWHAGTHGKQRMLVFPFAYNYNSLRLWFYQ